MSWLDPMEPDDALSQLLTDWRGELDAHAGMAMSTELPALPGRSRRWLRTHQRTAAAAAIVVAIAGSTSAAAAATGSTGPLGPVHDLLYGKPATPHIDYTAIRVRRILDVVAKGIAHARQSGSITTAERDGLSGQLDTAQQLIDGDAQAPAAVGDRVAQLRGALAAIPAPASPTPTSPHRGRGHHDTSGSDQPSRSGEDSQGSDDGQGDDRGGSQGSDDGSQNGTDGGGDSTSGDSTSGGDRGDQTDSGGGDDGSGGGDQSDDGGSVSSDSGDGGSLDGSQAADD